MLDSRCDATCLASAALSTAARFAWSDIPPEMVFPVVDVYAASSREFPSAGCCMILFIWAAWFVATTSR